MSFYDNYHHHGSLYQTFSSCCVLSNSPGIMGCPAFLICHPFAKFPLPFPSITYGSWFITLFLSTCRSLPFTQGRCRDANKHETIKCKPLGSLHTQTHPSHLRQHTSHPVHTEDFFKGSSGTVQWEGRTCCFPSSFHPMVPVLSGTKLC